MKAFAPLLGLFAAALAFAAPATAAASTPAVLSEHVTEADVNGDGQLDRVAVREIEGNQNLQFLVVTIGRVNYVARVPLSSAWGVQPLRVTDMNRDGRQEVVVTESVGANTYGFSVWGVFTNGMHQVRESAQTPLRLWEGGGASAINLYGCNAVNRELIVLAAEVVNGQPDLYAGTRSTYFLGPDGTAELESRTWATGFRDSAFFQLEPSTCA
jgi:hypothetical protein